MANGNMIQELRKLAESEKIPIQAAMQLLLSSQAEIIDRVNNLEKVDERIKNIDQCLDSTRQYIESLRSGIESASTELKEIRKEVSVLEEDFFIRFLRKMSKNPKLVIVVVIVAILFINIVSNRLVLALLMTAVGIDTEIISIIEAISTQIP